MYFFQLVLNRISKLIGTIKKGIAYIVHYFFPKNVLLFLMYSALIPKETH